MRLTLMTTAALAAAASSTFGVTNPFTEEFVADAAGWTNFNNSAPLTFNLTGGPDNSSYVSGTFNFASQAAGATPVVIRGQNGASGGAFVGDWLAAGVTQLSVFVRQNTGQAVTFFARPSVDPAPGAVAIAFTPVPSGVWTQLTFAINPASPQFVSFETGDFNSVFTNIGRLQFGVSVPGALAGVNQDFAFDFDKVALVPSPVGAVVLGAVGLLVGRRRK